MITPGSDKREIKKVLEADGFISRAGFKPNRIKTSGYGTEIFNAQNPELQIFISSGNSEPTGIDSIVKNMVYEVTVTGNRRFSSRIDEVSEQIISLLNEKEIGNGHVLYLLDPPLELESDPVVYIVETTFLCQSTIFNVAKK